jgi:hypothetical protein
LSQNPRGIPQPRITLTSQAQGTKIHPHNLPDLLSGRGLTHEGQTNVYIFGHFLSDLKHFRYGGGI